MRTDLTRVRRGRASSETAVEAAAAVETARVETSWVEPAGIGRTGVARLAATRLAATISTCVTDGAEEAHRDHAYDSAERREAFAERMHLEGVNDQVVADRLRSDMSQGAPAAGAVKVKSATKARKGRGHGHTHSRETARGR